MLSTSQPRWNVPDQIEEQRSHHASTSSVKRGSRQSAADLRQDASRPAKYINSGFMRMGWLRPARYDQQSPTMQS